MAASPRRARRRRLVQVLPHLYLGSGEATADEAVLAAVGATHILLVGDVKNWVGVRDGRIVMQQQAQKGDADKGCEKQLLPAHEFIDSAKHATGVCMVSSPRGVAYCTATVACYLMRVEGYSFQNALRHILSRPDCCDVELDAVPHAQLLGRDQGASKAQTQAEEVKVAQRITGQRVARWTNGGLQFACNRASTNPKPRAFQPSPRPTALPFIFGSRKRRLVERVPLPSRTIDRGISENRTNSISRRNTGNVRLSSLSNATNTCGDNELLAGSVLQPLRPRIQHGMFAGCPYASSGAQAACLCQVCQVAYAKMPL